MQIPLWTGERRRGQSLGSQAKLPVFRVAQTLQREEGTFGDTGPEDQMGRFGAGAAAEIQVQTQLSVSCWWGGEGHATREDWASVAVRRGGARSVREPGGLWSGLQKAWGPGVVSRWARAALRKASCRLTGIFPAGTTRWPRGRTAVSEGRSFGGRRAAELYPWGR